MSSPFSNPTVLGRGFRQMESRVKTTHKSTNHPDTNSLGCREPGSRVCRTGDLMVTYREDRWNSAPRLVGAVAPRDGHGSTGEEPSRPCH